MMADRGMERNTNKAQAVDRVGFSMSGGSFCHETSKSLHHQNQSLPPNEVTLCVQNTLCYLLFSGVLSN